jgi:predicted permease
MKSLDVKTIIVFIVFTIILFLFITLLTSSCKKETKTKSSITASYHQNKDFLAQADLQFARADLHSVSYNIYKHGAQTARPQ